MKNLRIIRQKQLIDGSKEFEIEIKPPNNESQEQKQRMSLKLIMGSIIGFVNGFWGGGGGMICVPLLMQVLKVPEKKAHATTLLIMLPLSIASLCIYFTKGNLPINDALKIGIGFVIGGIVGAGFLKVINNVVLGIVFSLIIIAGGIKLLI